MFDSFKEVLSDNGLVAAFAIVGITMFISYRISDKLTKGKLNGSAIAIIIGLILAYIGGVASGGEEGLSDIQMFSGIGLMGGGMLRDFAIIATAFGADFKELKNSGWAGIISLFTGLILSFVVGVIIALLFGYTNPVDLTTIGAGTATYIVGPVTGTALGASTAIVALSVAAGLVKSVLTMVITPMVAKYISLDNPRSALVFGGLLGTTSGVSAGLAATDVKLVPYGAMTATFSTGLGVLLCPSILFILTRTIFG